MKIHVWQNLYYEEIMDFYTLFINVLRSGSGSGHKTNRQHADKHRKCIFFQNHTAKRDYILVYDVASYTT